MRASIGFLLVLLFSCLNWSCSDQKTEPFDRSESKYAPDDFLNLRYSYPDGKPNLKAISKAQSAVRNFKQLEKSIPGAETLWRLEGPGNIGARINVISPHPTNADILLIGFSTGGIYKTVDGGVNWYPVFDEAEFSAVSAITYNPSNPSEIYAGTGDHNLTGLPFVGDGVHRSVDGGETWTAIGLEEVGVVSRIVIDPNNTNNIYVAAMGYPFAPDANRGLYKSEDGGASWNQILFLGESTGVVEIVLHPTNPNLILAAGWDRIRNNSTSLITGQGAKIFRSTDGGDNWTTVTNGLPQSDQCRIGITTVPSNPNRFYAEYIGVDFQVEGIYQSDDSGVSWQKKNGDGLENSSGGFGWYFGQIRSHPTDDQILYHCSIDLWRSVDGGNNWTRYTDATGGGQHADAHDVKFDANNNIWLATDGGLYRRLNGISAWEDMENIPTNQFYRVSVDPFDPGVYFGGMQDNGTAFGDSANLNNWTRIFGSDGFSVVFDPVNSDVSYVETQNGNIYKSENNGANYFYISTGFGSQTKPWDMYYFLSYSDPNLVYTGAQEVFALDQSNFASQFESISPNLTESDTASNATRFHFITHLGESPINLGLLYAGTSDGLLWRRPNNGNWELITTGLPDRYVTRVVPSGQNGDRVFVTHSGYRDGDNTALIHMSDDQGTSWIDISGDLPIVGINELVVYPNSGDSTLFIGTDFGVMVSLNRGMSWDALDNGFPNIPVYDMDFDIANNRLVASTYGRSIFSLDLEPIINPSQITVAGEVKTINQVPTNNVDIISAQQSTTTGTDGLYSFNLSPDPTCFIAPEKFGSNNNGVTVLDIVLLQRHIILLDTLPLLSQVAGDVNGSDDLTVTDAVQIQRSILLVDTVFDAGVWRFVPESFVFDDSYNAFVNPIPDSLSCNDATSNANFWALKCGDVSGNANPQLMNDGMNRAFHAINLKTQGDDLFELGWKNEEFLSGYQFKLNGVFEKDLILGTLAKDLYYHETNDGLTFIWTSNTGMKERVDQLILSFNSTSSVELDDRFINMAVGAIQGSSVENWELILNKEGQEMKQLEVVIFPNPTNEIINVQLPSSDNVRWEIFDQRGKMIDSGLESEMDRFEIKSLQSWSTGIYFLKITQGEHVSVQKIMRIP